MNFSPPPRRTPREAIVPMINVVFLLLIFFLMTARIAPPDPFGAHPPRAVEGGEPQGQRVLHIAEDGRMALGGLTGAAALDALSEAGDEPVRVRADGRLAAADLARILREIAARGAGPDALTVIRP